jgi:hypothetical protein
MKAVAMDPGKPGSAQLIDMPEPSIGELPSASGVIKAYIQIES